LTTARHARRVRFAASQGVDFAVFDPDEDAEDRPPPGGGEPGCVDIWVAPPDHGDGAARASGSGAATPRLRQPTPPGATRDGGANGGAWVAQTAAAAADALQPSV
jgi:hypothetical protein